MSNYTLWGLFGPATWPWWLATLAFTAALGRRWRAARVAGGLGVAAFLILAVLPTGHWLAEPLEARFDRPPVGSIDAEHVIVLAGAERLAASARRNAPEVNDAAERIIEGAALARALPDATLWIVGGVRDRHSPLTDADWTAQSWQRLGVAPARIRVIRGTLNTCENAAGVAAERAKGSLVLVTSALHMPRAIACFRAHGLDPIAYPVDYLNPPIEAPRDLFRPGLLGNIERSDRALHEWLGLVVYRLRGRTRELFPAP